jgi:hypothetical protein
VPVQTLGQHAAMCREPLHLASERFRLSGTLERHDRVGDISIAADALPDLLSDALDDRRLCISNRRLFAPVCAPRSRRSARSGDPGGMGMA